MKRHRVGRILSTLLIVMLAGDSSTTFGQSPATRSSHRYTPLVQAIERVRPAVVNIHSQKIPTSRNPLVTGGVSTGGRLSGMGTGVIIDERGYIVTNFHVIEDVSSLEVSLSDGSRYTASIVARDPQTDIAVLRIQPLSPVPTIPMGDSEDVLLGESVAAIGNAYGYSSTITQGIVSALHRDVELSKTQVYKNLIQTDAAINPGNSGGPLINSDGEMIGLNVAIRAGAQGIAFAIPVNDVKLIAAQLLSSIRGVTDHGIICRDLPAGASKRGRVEVTQVKGGPAAKAGVRPGDRLISIAGKPVSSSLDIERFLLDKKAGAPVAIDIERNGSSLTIALDLPQNEALEQSPSAIVWSQLGIRIGESIPAAEVRSISPQLNGGIRIGDVAKNGPSDRAGIRPGDVLIGLGQWETLNADNVVYALNDRRSPTESLQYLIIRDKVVRNGWLAPNAGGDDRLSAR